MTKPVKINYVNDEIEAMKTISETLQYLDSESIRRILIWTVDRFAKETLKMKMINKIDSDE